MRYLMIATHVPSTGTGGGMIRYAVELGRHLAERDDVELHVLATADGAAHFRTHLAHERVHVAPPLPTVLRSLVERHVPLRFLAGRGFDVVHGTKHLVPRRVGRATKVVTAHDMLPLDRPHDFGLIKRWLLRGPYLRSVGESDVVLAVSEATRARLSDYRPQTRRSTHVVPLAVSAALHGVAERAIPELVERDFALVVGDASRRKNLALAVDTWPEVTAQCPKAVLAVAGPPAWAGDHRGARWSELVALGDVLPLGHVTDGQLRWCYENAAVVLCPSMLEGFGLPAIEAAQFGAHVVTSDDPALCEASAPGARHVPGWAPDRWAPTVVEAMTDRQVGEPAVGLRVWSDVAEETVRAVRSGRAGAVGRHEDGSGVTARSGVDPYAAPLRVSYVLDDDAHRTELVDIVEEQRANGWSVTIGAPTDAEGEVVVAWGLAAAGRLLTRRPDRSGRAVVVVVRDDRPRPGLRELTSLVRIHRRANAVVVSGATAVRFWSRYPVPLARMDLMGTESSREFSALLVRARAWGRSA